jgi:hypothetical protein
LFFSRWPNDAPPDGLSTFLVASLGIFLVVVEDGTGPSRMFARKLDASGRRADTSGAGAVSHDSVTIRFGAPPLIAAPAVESCA